MADEDTATTSGSGFNSLARTGIIILCTGAASGGIGWGVARDKDPSPTQPLPMYVTKEVFELVISTQKEIFGGKIDSIQASSTLMANASIETRDMVKDLTSEMKEIVNRVEDMEAVQAAHAREIEALRKQVP